MTVIIIYPDPVITTTWAIPRRITTDGRKRMPRSGRQEPLPRIPIIPTVSRPDRSRPQMRGIRLKPLPRQRPIMCRPPRIPASLVP